MANKKLFVAIISAVLMLVMATFSLFSCGTKDKKFELSFNVDGDNYATITVTGEAEIQLPEAPSKEGYTFDGWFFDKDAWNQPFTSNSSLDIISGDMSVYAKFTPITYSITYELDGGTHNNPDKYTIESSLELANAQKAGYIFLGWYSDADYTTEVSSISVGRTGDMTLYAKFELATYIITYENTKGAENTNPSTYTTNSETITFSPLSKDGYTFVGWYIGDTKVMEISKGSTGDLTLTAKWDTTGYTITYHNVLGATHNSPESYDVEDQPLKLSAAIKEGYRFVGWYTDKALTNMVNDIAVGTTGNLNLYAKWDIIEYTATFKDGDAVVGTVKFTVESDSIVEPTVPLHKGYRGEWEYYDLIADDITIDAIYTVYNFFIDDARNTFIKDTDVITPELLGITARDSDGNNISVKLSIKSGKQIAGSIMTITAIVGDDVNTITKDFAIRVYGTPNIILNQDNYIVGKETNIPSLFSAFDCFNQSIPVSVEIEGEQDVGNTLIVTISATDTVGNSLTRQYCFGVLPSEKSFVELYVGKTLWKAFFVDDNDDYTLPIPTLDEGFESVGWIDRNGVIYSDIDGKGLVRLLEHTQLFYGVYKTGYTPIYTSEQLYSLELNKKYFLVIDLDLDSKEWTPIGTLYSPFNGEFNGNGNVISNFSITGTVQYTGLFGYNTGSIKNLGIDEFKVEIDSSSSHDYYVNYSGGLIGSNCGDVTNCYAIGCVTDSSSSGNESHNDIIGYTGGLIGNNFGKVINCYAMVNVVSHKGDNSVGGLIGYNTGDITNSYANGNVISAPEPNYSVNAGGLVGYNENGTITDSYAIGAITSDSNYSNGNAGGLIGNNKYGIITDCYANININFASGNTGGLVGYNYYSDIVNCCASGSVESISYRSRDCKVGGLIGLDYSSSVINSYAVCDVVVKGYNDNGSSTVYAGGLIGETFSNYCSTVANSYAAGSVNATAQGYNSSYAGGLVGVNRAIVVNCYATGEIKVNSYYGFSYAGGLVGRNHGDITRCYATGSVSSYSTGKCSYSGGLTGYNSFAKIMDCFVTGDINADSKYDSSYAGDLVGYIGEDMSIIENSYRSNEQKVYGDEKKFLGYSTPLENFQSKCWIENNLWTYEVDIWNFSSTTPVLDYNVISNTTVEIQSKDDLLILQGQSLVRKYVLSSNIDLDGISLIPIRFFGGTFDGSEYVIFNFKLVECVRYVSQDTESIGLFGYNIGTIRNLSIDKFTINAVSNSDKNWSGGLIGYNEGDVTNCYATGNIVFGSNEEYVDNFTGGLIGYNIGTVKKCHSKVDLDSNFNFSANYVGGLIGYNGDTGTIQECKAEGEVSTSSQSSHNYVGGLIGYSSGIIKDSIASGDVNFSGIAGGLAGYNTGVVINCYAAGNISAVSENEKSFNMAGGLIGRNVEGTINNCYSTGDVQSVKSNYTYSGGLVGENYGSIINCYTTGDVTGFGCSNVGGLVGHNTGGTLINCYATGNVTYSYYSSEFSICAGGLVGYNSEGRIKNCYATGNVKYSSYSSNTCAGGLIGYDNNGTIENSYRCREQEILGYTIDALGTEKDLSELQSVFFQSTTLDWSNDDWIFNDGAHPVLKNAGVTN